MIVNLTLSYSADMESFKYKKNNFWITVRREKNNFYIVAPLTLKLIVLNETQAFILKKIIADGDLKEEIVEKFFYGNSQISDSINAFLMLCKEQNIY